MFHERRSSLPQSSFPDVGKFPDFGMAKLGEDIRRFSALSSEEILPIQSELPMVIGTVADREWEFLSTASFKDEWGDRRLFKFLEPGSQADTEDIRLLRQGMPDLFCLITSDLLRFSPDARLSVAKLDRVYTEAGDTSRPFTAQWHTDGDTLPRYVISGDISTTECYQGPAQLSYGEIVKNSINTDIAPVSAPARAILRVGPFNIHRTPPAFTESGRRVFITFLAE
jgi:hypothetical protein